MKYCFGIFVILWSASQTLFGINGVTGSFIPVNALVALQARVPQQEPSGTINLSEVVGTGPTVITAPNSDPKADVPAATVGTTKTRKHTTKAKHENKKVTDVQGVTAASGPKTVTITSLDVEIVTPTSTAATSTTALPVANVVVSSGGFGGVAGFIPASGAPTAGAVVSINNAAFGGVVGVVQASTISSTDPASTSSSIGSSETSVSNSTDTSSSDPVVAEVTVTTTDTDPTTVTVTVGVSTIPLLTDTAPSLEVVPSSMPTDMQGNGAFGGAVGSLAFPTNLVSTASSFAGFGGIAGFAANTAQRKRNVFSTSLDLNAASGTIFSK